MAIRAKLLMAIRQGAIRSHGQCPQIGLHRTLEIQLGVEYLDGFVCGITTLKIEFTDPRVDNLCVDR